MTCVARMDASTTKFTKEKRKRKQQSPGQALKASLRQAAAQKRLTVGLNNSVNRFKRNSESVMVCLMLQGPSSPSGKVKDEVACNIQQTLLQAFCAENRISVVRVLADATLMRLVRQLAGKLKVEDASGCCQEGPVDCSLLVIERPAADPSPEDLTWAAACQGGYLDIRSSSHLPSD